MKIEINNSYYLEELQNSDTQALMEYLNDPEITAKLLDLPVPYTRLDAADWIHFNLERRTRNLKPLNFAIRNSSGMLIGGIGLKAETAPASRHRGEIGYYLGKPYWGKGIVSGAIKAFIPWLVENYGLSKIIAYVFSGNTASEKALLKNGFELEGLCRRQYFKNGKYIDAKLYSLLIENNGQNPKT